MVPYRILSLSGGGVRGIFQAVFLKKLKESLKTPIHKYFDLIAGTSTGSIIALATAFDIDFDRLVELYKNKSNRIFRLKPFYYLRKGARYNQYYLKKELCSIFGNKQLRDVETNVLISATCLDQFQHKIFSSYNNDDKELPVVDIALASSAAPTYFDPIKPLTQERSYADGGIWANSPALLAVLYAKYVMNIPFEYMQILSIGTGEFPRGVLNYSFRNQRLLSVKTIRTVLEMMFSSQQSSADDFAEKLLGSDNFIKVSVQMDKYIAFDNVKEAIDRLPALAEMQADDKNPRIIEMLGSEIPLSDTERMIRENEYISEELIVASGLTGFYPARKYYKARKDASSIDEYIGRAKKRLVMISINLMTGISFDNLCRVLGGKLEDKRNYFTATISLLNPYKAELVFAVSPILNKTKEQLFNSIRDTINELIKFRDSLSEEAKKRLNLRVHNTIPFGSAIMIDHGEPYGRIQIETKPYKAVLKESFAIELAPYGTSGIYDSICRGYESIVKEGYSVDELDLS